MQIRKRIKTSAPETGFEKDLERELLSAWSELSILLNGGLSFADNFKCDIVEVADTGVADTEFLVNHSLKKIPSGFLISRRTGNGVIYESATTWTISGIYLKSTSANNSITVLVF